jgi:hypothetical protein
MSIDGKVKEYAGASIPPLEEWRHADPIGIQLSSGTRNVVRSNFFREGFSEEFTPYNVPCAGAQLKSDGISIPPLVKWRHADPIGIQLSSSSRNMVRCNFFREALSEEVTPYNVPCAGAQLNSDGISMPPLFQGRNACSSVLFHLSIDRNT